MEPDGLLPDEVLLELGRLVWAAINLEDVVYTVCRSVEPRHGPFDDTFVSQRIDEALEDLRTRPDDQLRAMTEAWLAKAKEVLQERNAVLHSTPVTFVPLAPDIIPGVLDPELAHFPKNKNRSPVHTALTIEGLRPIRRRLEAARVGWEELAPALWERRDNAGRS